MTATSVSGTPIAEGIVIPDGSMHDFTSTDFKPDTTISSILINLPDPKVVNAFVSPIFDESGPATDFASEDAAWCAMASLPYQFANI